METDWSAWRPREEATLCFVFRGDEVLLIRKKRGLGAGNFNAPGGKLEPGETPWEAAVRETREEVGITPLDARRTGELFFQFADGYSLYCHVFRADTHEGVPRETDEAFPFWVKTRAVPYDGMWADDRVWLPHVIAGMGVRGWFEFDGAKMLSHKVLMMELSHFDQLEASPWRAS